MDASTLNLKNLFEPDRRYLVPLFQRPYVWNAEAQWKPLWEDVRALAERLEVPGEVRPHFLGAIVLDQIRQPTSRVEARLVIDGQQRLTTLYFYFSAAISEWLPTADPTSTDRIDLLYTALREKLRMVVIDLADKDDPQLIFETLNARGTPLLPADLVKNHLFHLARRADRSVEVLHEKYWKHFDEEAAYWRQEVVAGRVKRPRIDLFLQHYVAMQTAKEVQVAHLYSEFQDYLKDCGRGPEEELASIARYSQVFRSFDEHERKNRIGVFLSRLEDLEVTTAHPLLLCLFSLKLEPMDLEAAVVAIESFIVRRLVCHLTTKGYNKLFLDILRTIQTRLPDARHSGWSFRTSRLRTLAMASSIVPSGSGELIRVRSPSSTNSSSSSHSPGCPPGSHMLGTTSRLAGPSSTTAGFALRGRPTTAASISVWRRAVDWNSAPALER